MKTTFFFCLNPLVPKRNGPESEVRSESKLKSMQVSFQSEFKLGLKQLSFLLTLCSQEKGTVIRTSARR